MPHAGHLIDPSKLDYFTEPLVHRHAAHDIPLRRNPGAIFGGDPHLVPQDGTVHAPLLSPDGRAIDVFGFPRLLGRKGLRLGCGPWHNLAKSSRIPTTTRGGIGYRPKQHFARQHFETCPLNSE
jgi:hypothetical protein